MVEYFADERSEDMNDGSKGLTPGEITLNEGEAPMMELVVDRKVKEFLAALGEHLRTSGSPTAARRAEEVIPKLDGGTTLADLIDLFLPIGVELAFVAKGFGPDATRLH